MVEMVQIFKFKIIIFICTLEIYSAYLFKEYLSETSEQNITQFIKFTGHDEMRSKDSIILYYT